MNAATSDASGEDNVDYTNKSLALLYNKSDDPSRPNR